MTVYLILLLGVDKTLKALSLAGFMMQYTFSHWQEVNSDPLEENSKANMIVKDIRKRKGYPEKIPDLKTYID